MKETTFIALRARLNLLRWYLDGCAVVYVFCCVSALGWGQNFNSPHGIQFPSNRIQVTVKKLNSLRRSQWLWPCFVWSRIGLTVLAFVRVCAHLRALNALQLAQLCLDWNETDARVVCSSRQSEQDSIRFVTASGRAVVPNERRCLRQRSQRSFRRFAASRRSQESKRGFE